MTWRRWTGSRSTTLYENLVDMTTPGGGVGAAAAEHRPDNAVSATVRRGAAEPVRGRARTSMLVRITRAGVTRTLLFDAGGGLDGLIHNLDCLDLRPNGWSCIVLSHGHPDHTLGLIGLHRAAYLRFPLTLHPDATSNAPSSPLPATSGRCRR
ncbi:MAG: MBL fold metallo-hydrolase [Dehalococcoidia bacterium]